MEPVAFSGHQVEGLDGRVAGLDLGDVAIGNESDDAHDVDAGFEQQAAQLIQQGDTLYRQGNQEGARDKWQQAIALAPGTTESQQAAQNLQQTQPANPDFGGY